MGKQTDWHERGCSRSCRSEHTKVWGWCDLAEEPAPTLNLSIAKAFTASDGHTSVGIRQATVEEARAELAKFETQPDWADLREMARNAGFTHRKLARDWLVWTNKDVYIELRRRHVGGWRIAITGEFGNLSLADPTPARALNIARELGIGAS